MAEKAIFLDRDNTLIEDPGYINDPDQVKLLDGVPEALIDLKKMGYKLVVVSNQSGVARGIVTEKVLAEIHHRLKQLLGEKGAYLDKIYYCPYHVDGAIEKYRKQSSMRKPAPGMLLKASEDMEINIEDSWMIGNSSSDIEAGAAAGCKTILVKPPGGYELNETPTTRPDYTAVNIKEAVNIIKKYIRSPRKQENQMMPEPQSQVLKQQPEPEEVSQERPIRAINMSNNMSKRQYDETEGSTEKLLKNILEQLRSMHRKEMFDEFSIMRLLAGIIQIAVVFCMIMAVWFLMSTRDGSDKQMFVSLGFAAVLQLMSLTFYIMQGRK